MKSRIYYFTGTGNSLAVARRIAVEMDNCEIIPIVKALKNPDLLECEEKLVGFVFPNYYMGLPNIVRDFLEIIYLKNAEYIFTVVTSGHPFGIVNSQVKSILKHKGKKLSYGCYVTMPDNYLPMFNISPDKAENIISSADIKLESVIEDIKSAKRAVAEFTFGSGIILNAWNRFFAKRFAKKDSNFRANQDCNSCGVCVKLCPVDNIILKNDKPEWRHKCEQCLACIHLCPVKAINYAKSTQGKHRYRHPIISVSDIASQK